MSKWNTKSWQLNTTHPNHTEHILIQEEQKMNMEIIKRIMSEKKVIIPFPRNQRWKTVKAEKKKEQIIKKYLNQQHHRLNEQIYAWAKLVWDKIGVLLENANRNSKPGWEIKLETQIINLRQQTKMPWGKTRVYLGTKREKQQNN